MVRLGGAIIAFLLAALLSVPPQAIAAASDGSQASVMTAPVDLEAVIALALDHERAGRIEEAAAVYRAALKSPAGRQSSKAAARLLLAYSKFADRSGEAGEAYGAAVAANTMFNNTYGAAAPETVAAADHLGVLLVNGGHIAAGLTMARMTYENAVKQFGWDNSLTWRVANNYAEALRQTNLAKTAAGLDKVLLDKRIAHYGRASLQALVSASNLALDYLALGDEQATMDGFALQRDLGAELADPHSEHAAQGSAWLFYAGVYFHPGRILSAEEIAKITDWQSWNGAPDLLKIKSAELLGDRLERRGQMAEGLKWRDTAYRLARKVLGDRHPLTFEAWRGLAAATGRQPGGAAGPLFAAMEKTLFDWMSGEIMTAGDRNVAQAARAVADAALYDYGRFALDHVGDMPAFAAVLARWTAMDYGQRAALRLAIDDFTDPELKLLAIDGVRRAEQQQALLSSGEMNAEAQAVHTRLIAAQHALNTRLKNDPVALKQIIRGAPDIAAQLQPGDLLVHDFLLAKRKGAADDDSAGEDDLMVAALYRAGAVPVVVKIGDFDTLFPSALVGQDPEVRRVALLKALFAPFAGELLSLKRLFVVPAAGFFQIPLSLYQDTEGRRLDQQLEVHILTRLDALFRAGRRASLPAGGTALLVGGLDYYRDGRAAEDALPQSGEEVRKIQAILETTGLHSRLFTGDAGTEAVLRQPASQAAIIHFATHGFFLPDEDGDRNSKSGPMWRSGLVLAQPDENGPPLSNQDDNVLYAHEIMMDWDLSAADLVVLSACDTARGDEGVLNNVRGLPAALAIAGARRSLLTLWAVPDAGTAHFMTTFYAHVAVDHMSYAKALRHSRVAAMQGKIPGAENPAVWSAFVLFAN